jgi:hypothetical protein
VIRNTALDAFPTKLLATSLSWTGAAAAATVITRAVRAFTTLALIRGPRHNSGKAAESISV